MVSLEKLLLADIPDDILRAAVLILLYENSVPHDDSKWTETLSWEKAIELINKGYIGEIDGRPIHIRLDGFIVEPYDYDAAHGEGEVQRIVNRLVDEGYDIVFDVIDGVRRFPSRQTWKGWMQKIEKQP